MLPFNEVTAILVFAIAYIFIMVYYEKKAIIACSAVALLLVFRILSPMEALSAINWNVLGIYFGMLYIIEAFVFSKVPDYISIYLVNHAKKVSTILILISAIASFISISTANVAVVLIVAPIAVSITNRLKISPVPVLTAIAISANLQGVATLIGDPPSMLIAAYAKLTFNDFIIFMGKPSLFFAVQVAAIASIFVLYFFFRKHNHPHKKFPQVKPVSFFPGWIMVLLIVALSFSSRFDPRFLYLAGLLTIIFGVFSICWYNKHNKKDTVSMLRRVDYETGFFLAAIFVLVESLIKTGVIDDIANLISGVTGSSVIVAFIAIIVVSLVLSAFIDNIPYIAAMLPVVQKVALAGGFNPYLLYFGLLISASVGGNITPIGASANIVAMGIAEKEGYKPKFFDFVKIGLPFTIVATLFACAFIYFFFS